MSRVFISYRHVERDQEFAQHLATRLSSRGHRTFLDVGMYVGTRWAEEIETQVRSAEFFVVLLSADSILSDMLRREVELAHELERERRTRILPVRVGYTGELPMDLGAYLDKLQYTVLKTGQPYDPVCDEIIAAIEHFQNLSHTGQAKSDEVFSSAPGRETIGAPSPAADARLETGAMKPGSPFYVRRSADDRVERGLQSFGVTIAVKGPRQSGKSSLLARTSSWAKATSRRICYIDFQLLDRAHLVSLHSLLRCIAWKTAKLLKTGSKPDPWDDKVGDKDMLTGFIEDAVLLADSLAVTFIFDEVDRIFDFDYRDDFFGLVRGWHNRRATHEGWDRFDLVLSHSTDPMLWIQNMNESPFNVADRVELSDFNLLQIVDLGGRHGLKFESENDVKHLLRLLGGQPYLVRQALYTLAAQHLSLAELDRLATSESGPFGDHLRQIGWRFRQDQDLQTAIGQIIRRGTCPQESIFQRLKAAGLVRGESARSVEMRCELYERYFRGQLESSASHTA